jgi:hypothetical protein
MDSAFLPWYIHAPNSADDEELLIGVYGTEEEARAAAVRLKDKPGFVRAPRTDSRDPSLGRAPRSLYRRLHASPDWATPK